MQRILSQRLKECRKEKGLTQKQISSILHDDPIEYVYYEATATDPKLKVIMKLADLFGVSIDYLVGMTDAK